MGAYHRFQEDVVFGDATPTWKLKKKAVLTSLKMLDAEFELINEHCSLQINP